MKLYRLLFILLIFVSITSFRNDSFADKFSSDSALGVLDIGANIGSGNVIDENAWNRLFDTQGYQKYRATSRGNAIRVMIKEAVELAFSPDRCAEVDSILLLTPDANDYAALMSQNMSEEEIVRLLAHEFFHNYRDATLKNEPRDSFWKIFNSFENEGIADLIDKGEHPEAFYAKYGASFKKLYLDGISEFVHYAAETGFFAC